MSDEVGYDSVGVGSEGGIIVEVELVNLEENCVENNVGDVVGVVREVVDFVVVGMFFEY